MKKILKGALAALLTIALTIPMFSVAAVAEETPSVEIPVTIHLSGSVPSTKEDLAVVLTAADAACPMPESAVDGVYKMTVTGAVTQNMAPITFSKVGIHHYTIHQEPGTKTKGNYDRTVYDMTIYVTNAETGGLETTVVMHLDGVETKPGKVEFTNSYRSSGGGGGGGGSTPTPGGGTPSGGPGVTEIAEGEVPTTTILPFDIPLALPQTGTLWWLVPILAAAGAVMFVGGMMKNRKNREDDEM